MKIFYLYVWVSLLSLHALAEQIPTQNQLTKQSIKAPQERIVKIHNNITKDMLGYKYIIMNYPSSFVIKINNKVVAPGSTESIVVKDNTLSVQYEYEFGKRRKGSKIIDFKVDPSTTESNLTFSWSDDWRVKLSNGTPKKRTIIE